MLDQQTTFVVWIPNEMSLCLFTALEDEPGPWLFPECRLNEESIHNAVNSYISWVYKFL